MILRLLLGMILMVLVYGRWSGRRGNTPRAHLQYLTVKTPRPHPQHPALKTKCPARATPRHAHNGTITAPSILVRRQDIPRAQHQVPRAPRAQDRVLKTPPCAVSRPQHPAARATSRPAVRYTSRLVPKTPPCATPPNPTPRAQHPAARTTSRCTRNIPPHPQGRWSGRMLRSVWMRQWI